MPENKTSVAKKLKFIRIKDYEKIPVVTIPEMDDFLTVVKELSKNTIFVKYLGNKKNAVTENFIIFHEGVAYQLESVGYENLSEMENGFSLGFKELKRTYYTDRQGKIVEEDEYGSSGPLSIGKLYRNVTGLGYKNYEEFDKAFEGGFYKAGLKLEEIRELFKEGFESVDEYDSFKDSKFEILKDYKDATKHDITSPVKYEVFKSLSNIKTKFGLNTYDQCLVYLILSNTQSSEIQVSQLLEKLEDLESPFHNNGWSGYYGRNNYDEWFTRSYSYEGKSQLALDLQKMKAFSTLGRFNSEKMVFKKFKGIPLIIDGSNVAYNNGSKELGDKPFARHILTVINEAERLGFQDIRLYHDANLEHLVEDTDYLKKLREKRKIGKVPGKTDADEFIIEFAKIHDGYIITNDQFKDYIKKSPQDQEFIKTHRFAFMIDEDDKVVFSDHKRIHLAPVVIDNEFDEISKNINRLKSEDN